LAREKLLPKRVVRYIHETGVRSLDRLADSIGDGGAQPDAVQTLVQHWRAMTAEDKERFVDRVSAAVVEVVAASAVLPVKNAVKAARKVIKKQRKKLKKALKTKKKAAPPPRPKPKVKPKRKRRPKPPVAVGS